MIIRYLLLFFVFYLLYKLVFNLILPVSKASAQVRRKMQQAQEEALRQRQQAEASRTQAATPARETRPAKDDYIEFEELK